MSEKAKQGGKSAPARGRFPPWILKSLVAILLSAGVLAMLLVLAGVFHKKVPEEPGTAGERSAAGRESVAVKLLRRPRVETAVGTIRPVHEAAVASKLLAKVLAVNVKAGQVVARDDVLVQLDDSDLQARLKQAEAEESSAAASLTRAQSDFDRAKELLPKSAISKADYEQAQAGLKVATANLERARQGVLEAKVLLGYATIRSPMDGVAIDKQVQAGDTVSPGQTLLTLYDPTHMQMVASVRESFALSLKVGQQLGARIDSLGYQCEATVSEIVPEAQAASRSFLVKVTGPCPPGVYSGMFGRLLLPVGEEELIVAPRAAVQRVGQLTMVDVLSEGHVQRRFVQLGRDINSEVEVLSGLRPGETVLLPADQSGGATG